jgi:hypothetical protein
VVTFRAVDRVASSGRIGLSVAGSGAGGALPCIALFLLLLNTLRALS